jgi:hypothetical protein
MDRFDVGERKSRMGDCRRRCYPNNNSSSNKTVRFDLDRNTEQTFVVPNDIAHEDLWFTATEFDQIKQTSRTESREWRKVYSHLLNETYEHPRVDAQDYLIAFCLMQGEDLYRRGLERQCNRQHGEQRSDAKDRARFLVLETQRRFKLAATKQKKKKKKSPQDKVSPPVAKSTSTCTSTTTNRSSTTRTTTSTTFPSPAAVPGNDHNNDDDDDDDGDDDDDEQQLANLYMESCRFAKLFAHRIAKADEIVALGKMMDCAARTQVLVTPQFKRRGSGMSIQSNESLDSRMLLLHQYQGRHQQQQQQLHQQHQHYPLRPPSPRSINSPRTNIRRGSGKSGSTASFKSWSPQQQHQRNRTACPASPLSLGRAAAAAVAPYHHHEAYAAIA